MGVNAMITGSEEESRALMMEAAIRIVARHGFEGFTTKKWAAEAGVAEGSLYYHFDDKGDLLNQAFIYIDREMAAICSDISAAGLDKAGVRALAEELWKKFYHYLIDHPDRTMYYYRFRTSPRYTAEIREVQETYLGSFLSTFRAISDVTGIGRHIDWTILWNYILDTTTALAFRMVAEGGGCGKERERQILHVMMTGLVGLARS